MILRDIWKCLRQQRGYAGNRCGTVLKYSSCRDCGRTTKDRYLEILEFTHFVDFFSFNRLEENHKEKVLVDKVTVVVALDLGTGNTKNPEI